MKVDEAAHKRELTDAIEYWKKHGNGMTASLVNDILAIEHSQKPPERTTRSQIRDAITCYPHDGAEHLTNRILDVLSNPSPGVVGAMTKAEPKFEGVQSERSAVMWVRAQWQAGLQAIKRGEG